MEIPLTDGLMRVMIIMIVLGGLGIVVLRLIEFKRTGYRLHILLSCFFIANGVHCLQNDSWAWCISADRQIVRTLLGTVTVVVLAFVMFMVKLKHLRFYAIIEMVFAIGMAGKTMWELQDSIKPLQALTIFASSYLFVRGLDNFKKDMDERRKSVREIDVDKELR